MRRKINVVISFLLAAVLMLVSYPAYAQSESKIYVTSANATKGAEAEVSVKLFAPGANSCTFTIEYNSTEIEYKSHTTLGGVTVNASSDEKIRVGFGSADAVNKEETIITVKFNVKETVKEGYAISVKLSDVEVEDVNGKVISVSISNGTITIGSEETQTQSPAAFTVTAIPTASKVTVNGKDVAFDAYTINGNNYFKLRDIAYALNGTSKQFDVGYDSTQNAIMLTSGKSYTVAGGEMASKGSGNKNAIPTASKIFLDGKEVKFTAYTIDGNNYFKLRDIGEVFNFGVDWDGASNSILIDTNKNYNSEPFLTPKPTEISLTPAPVESKQFVGNLTAYDSVNTYDFALPYDGKVSLEFSHNNLNTSSVYWKVTFINKNDLSEIMYLESRGDRTRVESGYNAYIPKGDYTVKVVSNGYYNWSDINYTITVYSQKNVGSFEIEPNDDFSGGYTNANKAEVNRPMIGNIITYDDIDCFQYILTAPGKIWLSFEHNYVDSTSEYWEIQLLSKTDGTKLIGISSKGNTVKTISDYCAFVPAGEYIVRVKSKGYYNWSGMDYAVTLNYEFNDGKYEIESNDTFQTANKIELGKPIAGNILTHDDVDYFSFSIPSKKEVYFDFGHFYFDSTSNYWEVVLLGKNDGKEYARLESKGTNVNKSSDTVQLDVGEYVIKVSSKGYYNWSRMEYTLTVKSK